MSRLFVLVEPVKPETWLYTTQPCDKSDIEEY